MCITNLGKVIMRVQWFLGRRELHMYQKLYQLRSKTNSWNLGHYKDSLRTVMCTSEIKNDGYDEPEYKEEAMDT